LTLVCLEQFDLIKQNKLLGGLNLKPTGAIETMHMDMSGSAAVLAAVKAAAILKLKVNIVRDFLLSLSATRGA